MCVLPPFAANGSPFGMYRANAQRQSAVEGTALHPIGWVIA
jgi:hypothetical protein